MVEREGRSGPENKEFGQLVNVAIAVHTSGLHENPGFRLPKISWDARMRLTATGELWQRLQARGLEVPIFVAGGNNFPTLASSLAMVGKEDLVRRFEIPQQLIMELDSGGNTVSDMDLVLEEARRRKIGTIINISSRYHQVARTLAEKKGMEFRDAESLLQERHRLNGQIIKDIYDSQAVRNLEETQSVGVVLIKIPVIGERIYDWRSRRTLSQRATVTVFDPYGLQKMTGKLK